jgi:hypothetical protein
MKLPRRNFLHLAAGAAALPVPAGYLSSVQWLPLRARYPGRADTPIVVRVTDHHDASIGGQCDSGRGLSRRAGADRILVHHPLTAAAGEHRDGADTPLVANPAHDGGVPSADSATDMPCRAPLPTNLSPCCAHTPPVRVNTHAAPAAPRPKGIDRLHGLSPGPPRIAVLPSADSATDMPWQAFPTAPVPTRLFPCCLQTPLLRVNTQAAPVLPLSDHPPTIAVLPSADSATDIPWRALPNAPVPTNLFPCWVQTPPLRVNTHAPSARHPPTMAVLPSADSATDIPWPSGNAPSPARWGPVPTNLLPCCVHTPPLRVNTHAAPVVLLSLGPPTSAVLPSADSATDAPWDHNPPA